MIEIVQNIYFLYPYVFLALIPYFICSYYCKVKNQSIYFSNTALLEQLNKKRSKIINIIKFLIIFFILFALASPVTKKDISLNNNQGYEIALILDASDSMIEANKFKNTKDILTDFIKKRKYDRLSLSVFADFAYVAVPLTYDKKSLLSLLKHIEVGVAGRRQTALYEALYLSVNLFKNSKAKEKIAILLTDGYDNTNTVPLDIAIAKAKKYNIKVYTIGVGVKGDFDEKVLQKIAQKTNGKFFNTNDKKELKNIYEQINTLEKSKIKTDKYIKKEYYFAYAIDIALAFLFMLLILNRKYS